MPKTYAQVCDPKNFLEWWHNNKHRSDFAANKCLVASGRCCLIATYVHEEGGYAGYTPDEDRIFTDDTCDKSLLAPVWMKYIARYFDSCFRPGRPVAGMETVILAYVQDAIDCSDIFNTYKGVQK